MLFWCALALGGELIPFAAYALEPARWLQVSPDGSRVAWRTTTSPYRLMVAPVDHLDQAEEITRSDTLRSEPWWAGNDQLVLGQWDRPEGMRSLSLFDLDTGAERTLMTGSAFQLHTVTPTELVVSRFSTLDHAASDHMEVVEGDILEVVLTRERQRRRPEQVIVRVDLATGTETELWRGKPFGYVLFDPSEQPAVGVRTFGFHARYDGEGVWIGTQQEVWGLRPGRRSRRLLTIGDHERSGDHVMYVGDGRLWAVQTLDGRSSLVSVDLASGKARTVLQSLGPHIVRAEIVDGDAVALVASFDDIVRFDDPDQEVARVHQAFTRASGAHARWPFQRGEHWFSYVAGPGADTLWMLGEDAVPVPLVPPGKPEAPAWRPSEPLRFPARDGLPLTAYLTRPDPDLAGEGPWPTVLLVHGGPIGRDTMGFDPDVQRYADLGYAVLRVNFRGSTGFGSHHAETRGLFGRAMQTDLLDALDVGVAMGAIHPDRVAIAGASYGGYATLQAMVTAPERFACGSAGAAVADLRIPLDDPLDVGSRADAIAGSPVTHVEGLSRPLLLWHGSQDQVVPIASALDFATRAEALGKPITWLVFPDGHHGLGGHDKHALRIAEAHFLQACLGGRAEPWDAWPAEAKVQVDLAGTRIDGLLDALLSRIDADPDPG